MQNVFILFGFTFLSFTANAHDLALNWKPEPEFGGFYEALRSNLYDKGELKINILPGGAGQPVAQMVAGKKASFGIASADEVILARAQGAKIVAIFAVYQNDPQGFMVHEERGIKSLKELFQTEGTIALQKGLPYTLWLEKKYAPVKANIVPYTGGIASFIQNPKFSQQCFITSEPLAARREKINPKTFLISESGFNPYLTVVIAHEDLLKADPNLVKNFVDSTRLGWVSYLAHPEATNQAMQKLYPSLDLETFNEASRIQKPFIETEGAKKSIIGAMNKERWQTLYGQMLELKLVKPGMDANQFFRSDFLTVPSK